MCEKYNYELFIHYLLLQIMNFHEIVNNNEILMTKRNKFTV